LNVRENPGDTIGGLSKTFRKTAGSLPGGVLAILYNENTEETSRELGKKRGGGMGKGQLQTISTPRRRSKKREGKL